MGPWLYAVMGIFNPSGLNTDFAPVPIRDVPAGIMFVYISLRGPKRVRKNANWCDFCMGLNGGVSL